METRYLSCAETAKLLRSALAESFPSVKFAVRSKVYSGGASIDVSWTDGPTSDQVHSITGKLEGSYFDGMIDYKGSIYHKLDGESVSFSADFIFPNCHYSDELIQRGIEAIVAGYGGCEPITVGAYRMGRARSWVNSGGCDLERALNIWLSGRSDASWIAPPNPGMEPVPSKTLARIQFAGSDEYGAPYGARGYPQHASN